MILLHQSLHVLHFLFSKSPLHYTYIYIYIFICVHIPNSGVPILPPPLLSDSLVVQPPLYSLPSPEAGVLRGFVPASPAVLATYSSWWGCSRSLHGWEKAMKGGRRRRKRWALARQHKKVPVISCRRKLCSPPEALLWLRALSTDETARTNVWD